jgi:DNA-binding transcriptional ArsR family regulator
MPALARVALLLSAALLLTPQLAHASSDVDAGAAHVEVIDQRGTSCPFQPHGVCVADESDLDDPANASVDVSQEIAYVGLGAQGSDDDPLGVDYTLDGHDGSVTNPVLPFVGETWSSSPLAPGVPGILLVEINADHLKLEYNSINQSDPYHPIYWHYWGIAWPDGQNRVGYSRIGPFNEMTSTDTDTFAFQNVRAVCNGPFKTRECHDEVANVTDAQANATPNVRLGLVFHQIEATSNLSDLDAFDPSGLERAPAYVPWQSWEKAPPLPLPPPDAPPGPFSGVTPRAAQGMEGRVPHADATRGVARSLSSVAAGGAPQGPGPVIAVALAVGGLAVLLVAAVLYARIQSRTDAMTSRMRRAIVERVAAHPGVSPSRLARDLGVTRNTVMHHARILARMRLLRMQALDGGVFLLPAVERALPEPLLLRSASASAILAVLRSRPGGLPKGDLVALTADLPKRTRNHALKCLVEEGVVEARPHGEETLLALVAVSASAAGPRGARPAAP